MYRQDAEEHPSVNCRQSTSELNTNLQKVKNEYLKRENHESKQAKRENSQD
jgi:hypothetical protein